MTELTDIALSLRALTVIVPEAAEALRILARRVDAEAARVARLEDANAMWAELVPVHPVLADGVMIEEMGG